MSDRGVDDVSDRQPNIARDELDWATLEAAIESHEDAHGVLAGQEAREALERLRTNYRVTRGDAP